MKLEYQVWLLTRAVLFTAKQRPFALKKRGCHEKAFTGTKNATHTNPFFMGRLPDRFALPKTINNFLNSNELVNTVARRI